MKQKFKIFLIFSAILSLVIINNSPVFAATDQDAMAVLRISDYLKENGTSVNAELTKLSNELKAESSFSQIDNKENIKQEIETLNNLKEGEDRFAGLTRSASNSIGHGPVVAAVIAWFNYHGYTLSAELLTHMRANKKRNSSYSPVHGNVVKASPVIASIARGKKAHGSASFPNAGNVKQKDCYYGIHRFNFSKPTASSKTVNIIDLYDYAYKKMDTIEGIATTSMYSAQLDGYLTPFYTKIKVSL